MRHALLRFVPFVLVAVTENVPAVAATGLGFADEGHAIGASCRAPAAERRAEEVSGVSDWRWGGERAASPSGDGLDAAGRVGTDLPDACPDGARLDCS